jgi:hypothetical protein
LPWTSKESCVHFLVLEMMSSNALIAPWFPDHT